MTPVDMPRITFTAPDNLEERIDEHSEKIDENRSETVRELITKGLDAEEEISKLEEKVSRLRNEKRQLIEDREEKQELVEYVEQERELQREEQRVKSQPVWSRAKVWVFGRNGGG